MEASTFFVHEKILMLFYEKDDFYGFFLNVEEKFLKGNVFFFPT